MLSAGQGSYKPWKVLEFKSWKRLQEVLENGDVVVLEFYHERQVACHNTVAIQTLENQATFVLLGIAYYIAEMVYVHLLKMYYLTPGKH